MGLITLFTLFSSVREGCACHHWAASGGRSHAHRQEHRHVWITPDQSPLLWSHRVEWVILVDMFVKCNTSVLEQILVISALLLYISCKCSNRSQNILMAVWCTVKCSSFLKIMLFLDCGQPQGVPTLQIWTFIYNWEIIFTEEGHFNHLH